MDMSTDIAWEEWGQRDPYFGVITDPKFRRSQLDEDIKQEFFESGEAHISHVLATIRKHIAPDFEPHTVLDFGCGVGRLLVPFAAVAREVVGLDVSPSMLKEARLNCEKRKLHNVRLLTSDDSLSGLSDTFDLIHSSIVFQHIPVQRGRDIFGKLLKHLRPGGVGAMQLTYSKACFASTHGSATPGLSSPENMTPMSPKGADPVMQMNPYNINEILFLMQRHGIEQFHAEFSDHGGELGVFLFFSAR
jgi:2-polyprenyl-3-methyl-5-hydroxy-6-metoxy-1,4-benzoquinol methylase